ncbi:hypothetical protein HH303_09110 [Rhodospirillaceae bacterium KN72]|uniref:Uncharacterized protein n=1 Tax=Pacificispira spongiicola TaxID=2729598 RepID=A0A7Y0DZW4_9PROT|nr:hypothetical protein [Pacificispira spongiicola]NMM44639.1 hypothetical protein [Pacificispira spongiicola]
MPLPRRTATIVMLLLLFGTHAAQAQEIFRSIPDTVAPEAHGDVKTRTGGHRVNFPVDPATLSQKLSAVLSEACANLEFNQRRKDRYFIPVTPPGQKRMRFGYAQGNGLNLYDPKNLRGQDQAYLFYLDGTSECRVYVYAMP